MQSQATTVEQYLAELPDDRRAAISAVRKVILKNFNKGYEEGMQYGAIGYYVPHSLYPAGYHCDPRQPLGFAALASQKNYMSLYMMPVYCDGATETTFRDEWIKTGKKLWQDRLPGGGQATPMTFRLRESGKQYVVISAGGHKYLGTTLSDALVAYTLED